MKIAATQINAIFADVNKNLAHARKLVEEASSLKAELILFPEFFTSAIGYSERMLNVAKENSVVNKLLCEWANDYNIIIGGSFISLENGNAYNLFELVFPNGKTYRHKKDIPTQFENCYYSDGDKINVFETPVGNIGVALCWEMIRYDTVRRMTGKIDFVLSGSCWWDLPEDAAPEREPLRLYNQSLALNTPAEFAKLLNVPVIHANHCGKVTSYNFMSTDKMHTRQYVGAAQIINKDGSVIKRRSFEEGEGLIISDVKWDIGNRPEGQIYKDRYWIPDLPDSYIKAWETINPQAKKILQSCGFSVLQKFHIEAFCVNRHTTKKRDRV